MDTTAWPDLVLIEQIHEGNRNEVWRARIDESDVAVRQSRRTEESLDWELDLLEFLASNDFMIAEVVSSRDGRRHDRGVVVQRWLEGSEPTTSADWRNVAETLQRLHSVTAGYPQRPDCCAVSELVEHRRSVDADLDAIPPAIAATLVDVFATVAGLPTSVIHGDAGASNLRILQDGRVGLLDLDESRVDVALHDLSELGVQVLGDVDQAAAKRLSNAWEAANAWTAEPEYARRRLQELIV